MIMVVCLTAKVKQPLVTAVCRGASALDRISALDPGGRSAVDVCNVAEADAEQVSSGGQAAATHLADDEHRPIARHLAHALLKLPERDQPRAGDVPSSKLPYLADVQDIGRRGRREAPPQLVDVDCRHGPGHAAMLGPRAGAKLKGGYDRPFNPR